LRINQYLSCYIFNCLNTNTLWVSGSKPLEVYPDVYFLESLLETRGLCIKFSQTSTIVILWRPRRLICFHFDLVNCFWLLKVDLVFRLHMLSIMQISTERVKCNT